jgi:hypothetical protein
MSSATTKCGGCREPEGVMVELYTETRAGIVWRRARCVKCNRVGAWTEPQDWLGLVTEARELMYAKRVVK